jgi:hypothetical protein
MERLMADDGWDYRRHPSSGGDSRKLCTIYVDGGLMFVGVRMWNGERRRWESNGEPCPHEEVRAWRDLPEPALGFWDQGKLLIPNATR